MVTVNSAAAECGLAYGALLMGLTLGWTLGVLKSGSWTNLARAIEDWMECTYGGPEGDLIALVALSM